MDKLNNREKKRLFLDAKGGISLPVAGALYWLGLGMFGLVLEIDAWCFLALYLSGTIIPLGYFLAKPLNSDLRLSPPLKELVLLAIATMLLSIPISVILVVEKQFEYVPLTLAIGMGVHWPIFSWVYGQRTYLHHGIFRTVLVILAWYVFPEVRTVVIPLLVTIIYLLTVIIILRKVKALGNEIAKEAI